MEKVTLAHGITYARTAHRGAPYTLDGAHFLNAGELTEICVKSALGFAPEKEANTSFRLASDIEALRASVKSAKATLTSERLADNFTDALTRYLAETASALWIFAVVNGERVTIYEMGASEFRAFTERWARWEAERGVIRYREASSKMLAWLDERA